MKLFGEFDLIRSVKAPLFERVWLGDCSLPQFTVRKLVIEVQYVLNVPVFRDVAFGVVH